MNRYMYTILIMSILTLLVGSAVGQDASAGKTVFDNKCGTCHNTGVGPNLAVLSKDSPTTIKQTVRNGVPTAKTPMPAFSSTTLSDSDLDNVVAYITTQSTQGTYGTPSTTTYATTNVTNATTILNVTPAATTYVEESPAATTYVEENATVGAPGGPVTTTAKPSPGFDILIGIIGLLLIYKLKLKS